MCGEYRHARRSAGTFHLVEFPTCWEGFLQRESQMVNDIAGGSINLSEALGTSSVFTNVIESEEEGMDRGTK